MEPEIVKVPAKLVSVDNAKLALGAGILVGVGIVIGWYLTISNFL
jgi:hypothetical protein